jgi:hypothetical protein
MCECAGVCMCVCVLCVCVCVSVCECVCMCVCVSVSCIMRCGGGKQRIDSQIHRHPPTSIEHKFTEAQNHRITHKVTKAYMGLAGVCAYFSSRSSLTCRSLDNLAIFLKKCSLSCACVCVCVCLWVCVCVYVCVFVCVSIEYRV